MYARRPKNKWYPEDLGYICRRSAGWLSIEDMVRSILGIGTYEVGNSFTLTLRVKPYVIPYLYLSDTGRKSEESRMEYFSHNVRMIGHFDTTTPFKPASR